MSEKERGCGDGIIEPDSAEARRWGFTSDKFDGWLWRRGDTIWVSLIVSKHPGEGNFRRLMENILETEACVVVPTPSPSNRMCGILERMGFEGGYEMDEKGRNMPVMFKHVERRND